MYFISKLNYIKHSASVSPHTAHQHFLILLLLRGGFSRDNMIWMSCDQDKERRASLLAGTGSKTKNKWSSFISQLLIAKPLT